MPTAVPLRGQPFAIYDLPRIDNGSPPHKPPPSKGFGSYCFRAATNLNDGDQELMRFVGYDADFNITDKVEQMCKLHEKRGHGKCGTMKLTFIGAHPKCNGTIDVTTIKDE